jgi:hypothetical protein
MWYVPESKRVVNKDEVDAKSCIFHRFTALPASKSPFPPLASRVPNLLFLCGLSSAGVAQLVEHLICNQRVGGSNPSASSTR